MLRLRSEAQLQGLTSPDIVWMRTTCYEARAVVEKGGVDALTRASLLDDGIKSLTKFDAGGMIGAVNMAEKIPSACLMLDQFENGKFVRVYPPKKGTFDCEVSNTVQIKADLID